MPFKDLSQIDFGTHLTVRIVTPLFVSVNSYIVRVIILYLASSHNPLIDRCILGINMKCENHTSQTNTWTGFIDEH